MDTLQTSLVLSSAYSADNVINKEKKRDLRFFRACLTNIQRSLNANNDSEKRPANVAHTDHDDSRGRRGSRSSITGVEELDDSVDLFCEFTADRRVCNGTSTSAGNYTSFQQGNISSIEIESKKTAADVRPIRGRLAVYSEPASIIKHAVTQAAFNGNSTMEPVVDLPPRCAPIIDNDSHFFTSTVNTIQNKSSFDAEQSGNKSFLIPMERVSGTSFNYGLPPPVSVSSFGVAAPFTLKPIERATNISSSSSLYGGLKDLKISTHIYSGIAFKEVHSVPLADVFNNPRSIKTTGPSKI